jgi:hypothetical protein
VNDDAQQCVYVRIYSNELQESVPNAPKQKRNNISRVNFRSHGLLFTGARPTGENNDLPSKKEIV